MRTPLRPPVRRRAAARFVLLFALLPLVGLAGCDTLLGGEDEVTVEGTWVTQDGQFTFYLQITSSAVTAADGITGDCFYIFSYDIVSQTGDTYTLGISGISETFDVILRIEDGQLRLLYPDDPGDPGLLFQSSDQDLSELEECTGDAGGGSDPSIDCTSLPEIGLNQTVDGELTTTDDVYQGFYYDLYRLTLSSETQVQIDLMSDEIDTYLYLYGADGTYLDENDDGGSGLNSQLTTTLQAGCYRIEATSWGGGETGAYSVSVMEVSADN